jgi:hypothetical protein
MVKRFWDPGEGGHGFWVNPVQPIIPFNITVEENVDPFDELDDQGNEPKWPRVPGREEPPPFRFEQKPWLPPEGAPDPLYPEDESVPFWMKPLPVFPAPAVPEPATPENLIPPDAGNLWDKLTPGDSTQPGQVIPEIPKWIMPPEEEQRWGGGLFGFGDIAGMLPMIMIMMIAKD